MGKNVMVVVFITLSVYLILQSPSRFVECTSEEAAGVHEGQRRPVPSALFGPRLGAVIRARSHLVQALGEDPIIEEAVEEALEASKRMQFDDYGHMRFGKRGEVEEKFDDYGHMRFGRSHA